MTQFYLILNNGHYYEDIQISDVVKERITETEAEAEALKAYIAT